MINFDEELKHFKPSQETEDVDNELYDLNIEDVTDVVQRIKESMMRPTNGMF